MAIKHGSIPELDMGSGIRDLREWVDALGQVRCIGIKGPEVPGRDGVLAVVPDGTRLASLAGYIDEFAIKPHMRSGVVHTGTLRDFIAAARAWAVRDKTVVGVTVGNSLQLTASAWFDYHNRGAERGVADGEWARFKALFQMPKSDAHTEWLTATGSTMTTPEFAAFVENRTLDLYYPDSAPENARCHEIATRLGTQFATPADVMLASRGLQITSRRTVRDAVTLDDSSVQIEFSEANQPNIIVPSLFATRYWLWDGVEAIIVPWRLRYAVTDKGIRWSVRPFDLTNIVREAVIRVTDGVRNALADEGVLVVAGEATAAAQRP